MTILVALSHDFCPHCPAWLQSVKFSTETIEENGPELRELRPCEDGERLGNILVRTVTAANRCSVFS